MRVSWYHGFVRAADGAITTFDVAGAFGTNPTSINPSGTVTGSYDDLGGIHGFVRAVDGTLTTFFVDPPVPGTWSQSINPRGQITGWFRDLGQPGQPNTALRGFVRDTDGTLTTFAAPGASTLPFFGTQPVSINPKGEIVGYYRDDNGVFHGFLRKPDDHAGSGNTSDD